MRNMKHRLMLALLATLTSGLIGLSGCSDRHDTVASNGIRQTGFPGVVTAGGGSSGEVIARAGKAANGSYAGGTPFHAGGAGGNTGGTATAGTVQETGHGPSGASAPAPANPANQANPAGNGK